MELVFKDALYNARVSVYKQTAQIYIEIFRQVRWRKDNDSVQLVAS